MKVKVKPHPTRIAKALVKELQFFHDEIQVISEKSIADVLLQVT